MSELTPGELTGLADAMRAAGATVTGDLSATMIAGGRSNLTYRITDGTTAWVLRTPPRHGRTPSAHDVAREFRVQAALQGTDVPVADAVLLDEGESLLGVPFTVSGFVDGLSVQRAAVFDEWDAATLDRVIGDVVGSLARLHAVDYEAVGLGDFGRPDGYASRQLRRWSGQWDLVRPDDERIQADADELRARLEKALPSQQSRSSIVHGDYRIDNTLVRPFDDHPVAAIVDWELSTIGDPVADVAMMCAYRHPALDHVLGEAAAWTSPRLPSTPRLAELYLAAGGAQLEHWDFHLALAHFKIAAIAAGIAYRQRQGSGGAGFERAAVAVAPFLSDGLEILGA